MKNLFILLISLCFNIQAQNTPQINEIIGKSLLPSPKRIEIYNNEKGIDIQNIRGYNVLGKAKIPFGISSFPMENIKTTEGTITLELTKKIKSEEAYNLIVEANSIRISAKTQKGLFYGLITLQQIVKNAQELKAEVPALNIIDEPYSNYRAIHIDLKHHIDKKSYMYSILDKMASYKLNAIIVELEDKIKYETCPIIGASNAWSINEWQQWCEYANKLNIEVSPLIQGIGHADFILKHEEMKGLREDSLSDWVCCPSNKEYYKVQFGLYKDAIKATPYGKYLHVGGDEVGTLGVCPLCKKQNKNALEFQLQWLKKVSDFAIKNNRIPIFWDDMVFKQLGLYPAILDKVSPLQVDSIWEVHYEELNKHIKLFPQEVIYMRWQYGNANQPGNKKALKWYVDNNLKVMGATSAQTTHAMLPLGNFIENIKSFQVARKEIPIEGVLCTAWDDASPLSDTFWLGFIAHAQYSWNSYNDMSKDELDRRYRFNEFGYKTTSLENFRPMLESTFPLWETGLLDEGVRRSLYRTGGKFKLIGLPTEKKGEWSEKYALRINEAQNGIVKYLKIKTLLSKYRNLSIRNDYSLQVFERINELTGYTAELLVALSDYDLKRDLSSLNNLQFCINKFDIVRKNMENVYSQIRELSQPEDYLLPMNHHSHLAIQTMNSDWMFWYELEFLKVLKENIMNFRIER